MLYPRVIARLDVKGPNLVKGIHLEGLRKIGDPNIFAKEYYKQGADELIYMDIVASLYNRNGLFEILERTTKDVFVPITVGGGLRSIDDVRTALKCGADKVAINTAAIKRPTLISEVSNAFGSQCMVLSVEAKRVGYNQWEVYYDNGREKTGINVLSWIRQAQELGAGEILLTSVDCEGTQKGFDIELIKEVNKIAYIPVIASGGFGTSEHGIEVLKNGQVDAISIASALHYKKYTIQEVKDSIF